MERHHSLVEMHRLRLILGERCARFRLRIRSGYRRNSHTCRNAFPSEYVIIRRRMMSLSIVRDPVVFLSGGDSTGPVSLPFGDAVTAENARTASETWNAPLNSRRTHYSRRFPLIYGRGSSRQSCVSAHPSKTAAHLAAAAAVLSAAIDCRRRCGEKTRPRHSSTLAANRTLD